MSVYDSDEHNSDREREQRLLDGARAALAAAPQQPAGCTDPEHPGGAFCADTTGLPYCAAPQREPLDVAWACDWTPDDLSPGPECPYCAGDMCARFDGLECRHNREERHGLAEGVRRAALARADDGLVTCPGCGREFVPYRDTRSGAHVKSTHRLGKEQE